MLTLKMTSCKSLLLRAWRERWTDIQWSINIKNIIQKESPDDMRQLADLMVNQALVGSTPNVLIMSYLKHTISSKIINLVAAIQSVIKYTDTSKPYCIKSLFEVIEIFLVNVSVRGTSEDSLELAHVFLAFLHWLLDCMGKFIQKLGEGKLPAEYSTLLERGCDILDKILELEENRALLFIAKHDDAALYGNVEVAENMIWTLLGQLQNTQVDSKLRVRLHDSINGLVRIQDFPMKPQQNLDVSFQFLNISINVVTGIEAVLNPTNDISHLIEQLLVIEQSHGLSRSNLYCELLRTCMMGMGDAAGGTDELKWASFMFLKVPHILKHLVKQRPEKTASDELEQGLRKLLDYVPLLDATDAKCHCECLQFLMHELNSKPSVVTEDVVKSILNRRQSESQRQKPTEQPAQQPSAGLILRAEPTLYSILKTLDTDYSKNQEPLRGVLSQMMSGKSLELILAAAAARGKVQSFAMKIVKFNELSKHATGEGATAAQIRATIFDISFLMLCHISQLYGLQMITSCPEGENSFFAQWATKSLPEEGKYKSLDVMLPPDNMKVEVLLGQINPGSELRMSLTRWHEVCQNVPYAIQEVLYAWEHGTLQQETVQQIVENLKFRMCCLPVVVVSWLCSFITLSNSEARKKPLQILHWFVTPSATEPSTKSKTGPSELSNLMMAIMRRMAHDFLPQLPGIPGRSQAYTLPPTTPIAKALVEKFHNIFQKGCISIEAIHQMEYLLNVGGTLWFCENIVKEVLKLDRVEDINKGVSLAFSLFHLDLTSLTLDLVHIVVPQLAQVPSTQLRQLMDPRGRALARLAVLCLCACHRAKSQAQKEGSPVKRGKKRSRTEIELETPEDPPEESRAQKLRRLSSACEDLLPPSFGSDAFSGLSNLVSSKEESEPTYDVNDPLNKALVNLFRLFSVILSQNQASPRTGFVSSFIEEVLKCGNSTSRYVLQFMPNSMVSQLMKSLNNQFSTEILLHICDLGTVTGRKTAAKILCQHASNRAREAKS